jgi:predicted TPR repeat methyltransferase
VNSVRSYFDSVAGGYSRSRSWVWAYLRDAEARTLWRAVGDREYRNVMELGCGSGYYSRRLSSLAGRFVCVDFSSKMLEQIDIPGVEKVNADIQEVTSDVQYDLILCAGALEFVQQPGRVFAKVESMLAADGRFVLLAPKRSCAGVAYRHFHRRHDVAVRLFTEADVLELALSSGLIVREAYDVFPLSTVFIIEGTSAGR